MSLPVYSMTAYARQQASIHRPPLSGQYTWELRSVNQRYLEVNFKLPDALRYLEGKLRELLKSHLARGKVDISLSLLLENPQQGLHLNQAMLQQLHGAVNRVQETFIEATQVNPLEILKWPGILNHTETQIDDAIEHALLGHFEQTLLALKQHRLREGQALGKVLLERCAQIIAELDKLSLILPEIRETHRERLQEKWQTLAIELDPQRLAQEAAILAQKVDIDEEIQRIQTHLDEVQRTLHTEEPKGRRLDFLMQELNREANTLGSKSIDTRTSQTSVELKVLIEQMREQVQNIE